MTRSHLVRLCGSSSAPPEEAEIVVDELSTSRRVVRAIKGLAMWFAAGVVCVFIPIAHFVLVPFCVFGSLFLFARRLGQNLLVVQAHGRCPDCGSEQELDMKGPWPGRTSFTCRQCHRGLHLILNEGLPTPQPVS